MLQFVFVERVLARKPLFLRVDQSTSLASQSLLLHVGTAQGLVEVD